LSSAYRRQVYRDQIFKASLGTPIVGLISFHFKRDNFIFV